MKPGAGFLRMTGLRSRDSSSLAANWRTAGSVAAPPAQLEEGHHVGRVEGMCDDDAVFICGCPLGETVGHQRGTHRTDGMHPGTRLLDAGVDLKLEIDDLGNAFEDDLAVRKVGESRGIREILLADGQLIRRHEALGDHLAEVLVVGALVLGDHLRPPDDECRSIAVAGGEYGQAVPDHAGTDDADVRNSIELHSPPSRSDEPLRNFCHTRPRAGSGVCSPAGCAALHSSGA